MKIPFKQGEKRSGEINKILIEEIEPNPFQPRMEFKQDEIMELAESIKNYGIIQPIIVRKKNNRYELVAGERRLRACKYLGMKEITAIIKEIEDQEIAEIAIIENLQRKDLNFIEEAKAYQRLINEFSLTQQELAERLGKSQSTIANKIRLLNLPTEVCNKINFEEITERHARALLKLDDVKSQLEVIKQIKEKNLSVKETEKIIEKIKEEKEKKENKKRVYTVYKDLRLFINTLNNTIKEMKEAGLDVEVKKNDKGKYLEYIIRLPRTEEFKK